MRTPFVLLALSMVGLASSGRLVALEPSPRASAPGGTESLAREEPFVRRSFNPVIERRWVGAGISYGPHRDGQRPGGPSPSIEELREDLHIIAKHWGLLRLYSSRDVSEPILRLIRSENLKLKVMLGVWIATEAKIAKDGTKETVLPKAVSANRAEVETAIRLTNAYPDVVLAVSVGNETHVSWSSHKVRTDVLVGYIRQVRAGTKVPVTTADDFNVWNKPASKVLTREIDFIVTHAYAMWNKQPFARAMSFTKEKYAEVVAMHPDHQVVIGEAGWATQKHNQGEQSWLIIGEPGEERQKQFYDAFVAWTTQERIASFYFEAFDENWKGGSHPNEVEKHWGLFRADRTPKKAMQE